jgi:hypothetical protein
MGCGQTDLNVAAACVNLQCHGLMKKLENTARYRRQLFWLSVYFGLNIFLLAFYFLCTALIKPRFAAALQLL